MALFCLTYHNTKRPYINLVIPFHTGYDLGRSIDTGHNVTRVLLTRLAQASGSKVRDHRRAIGKRDSIGTMDDAIIRKDLTRGWMLQLRPLHFGKRFIISSPEKNIVWREV